MRLRSIPAAAASALFVVLLIAAPAAAGQHRGGSSGGHRGGSSGGHSGGGQGRSHPAPKGGNGGSSPQAGGSSGGETNPPATTSGPTTARQPASVPVVGHAPVRGAGGGPAILIPNGFYGGFYPWGFGGYGFGGYYGGYYDPWYYGGYGGYGYPPSVSSYGYGYEEAGLRLKVSPRTAEVYVDGYYAGIVDDFDGAFQRLHVQPGEHKIEIRADGYRPLDFEIRSEPGRTITYRGKLEKEP